MIKKALNHDLNTVCVNSEQVERMLEVFEKLGMLPPSYQLKIKNRGIGGAVVAKRIDGKWEPEDEET